MPETDGVCEYWDPTDCAGSVHCPLRCPRFVDREGTPWVVRPAGDDDREALFEMYDDFDPTERAQGVPPRKRPRIETWIDGLLEEGCNFVVAGEDGVVGHALYTPTDDAEPEFAVFVHQDYQERGIGTEVSEHVLATAAVGDRDALTLVVDPNNGAARRLYDRLGFEPIEQLRYERRGRRTDHLRMRRPLSTADAIDRRRPPTVGEGWRPERGPTA